VNVVAGLQNIYEGHTKDFPKRVSRCGCIMKPEMVLIYCDTLDLAGYLENDLVANFNFETCSSNEMSL